MHKIFSSAFHAEQMSYKISSQKEKRVEETGVTEEEKTLFKDAHLPKVLKSAQSDKFFLFLNHFF